MRIVDSCFVPMLAGLLCLPAFCFGQSRTGMSDLVWRPNQELLQPIYKKPEREKYGYAVERALIKGGAVFLSGAIDGLSETLIWH